MTTLMLVLAACLGGPPLVVGLAAVGVPWQLSAAVVSAIAIVVLARTVKQARAIGASRLHWPTVVAALAILGAATFYTARLSVFMADEARADLSVFPNRPFFRSHSCLSAYTEAARLAPTGVNIYDIALYDDPTKPGQNVPRRIGPFELDLYQYPPAFLLLPASAVHPGLDFMTIRRVWFAVQSIVLLAALLVLPRWIGGRSGLVALLLVPIVWLAPTTRLGLQIGNFQLTAFPLAMLAMMAFARGRAGIGGVAFAFPIVSKIFPGVLGIPLIVDKQWRAVGWTALSAVILSLAAWGVVGTAPFVDFVRYQLPRIQSGSAFPWITGDDALPINFGIHGLMLKLQFLGVPLTGPAAASLVATLYALILVLVAIVAALQLRRLAEQGPTTERLRLRQAQVWLGLLSLASFRSPFVPDAYALFGTLWLLVLVAAEGGWSVRARVALAAVAAATMIVLDGGVIPRPLPAWIIAASLVWQMCAIGFNAAIVLTPARGVARSRIPVTS